MAVCALNSRQRLAGADSGRCDNPLCSNLVEPASTGGGNHWRRTPRKFCSDQCKSDAWAVGRVRALLGPLPADKRQEILFGQDQTSWQNHCEITVAKTYRCTAWPKLRIGKMISFCDGLFTTSNRDLQELIETRPYFGVQIRETR
jgi:hypothetical protein